MYETVMSTKALPEFLSRLISTERVRIKEANGIIQLIPIKENKDRAIGLRGLFSEYPDMSLDKFLERKHADKELDL
ncbi:MAG: hypothetical protein LBV40_02465 [Methanomicrobiales archaeon]|jgi:hypothetical protein|nr:hypothetical protein [Methanomicrobiales archaeon]